MVKITNADFKQLASLFEVADAERIPGFKDLRICPKSKRTDAHGVRYLAVREIQGDSLLVYGDIEGRAVVPASFSGLVRDTDSQRIVVAPVNTENVRALIEVFPNLAPVAIGSKNSSFGVGDRLGIASPGHIRLFADDDIVPVLAQQSLRELDLMGRSYRDVIDAAVWAVFCTGYKGRWVADGDHLKKADAIISALEQGCTMITADLSDHLAFEYMDADIRTVVDAYKKLESTWRTHLEGRYRGEIRLRDGSILDFNPEILQRLSLTYGEAIDHAEALHEASKKVKDDFDFEISIDETDLPTSPEAHYFVAKELAARDVPFTSLAPRFVGEFQKGIDYIGNLEDFTSSFAIHAAIAAELGYKISIHSSSDKFSVYPIIGRLVMGPYHLKTSGTNWLIALETIARVDPDFFRELFAKAYEVFPTARAYYHITPDMTIVTDLSKVNDADLPEVLANPTDRQVMHVSYGELFKDSKLKARYFAVIRGNIEAYWDALESHIGRHLELLKGKG